jgi:hypothetical protein
MLLVYLCIISYSVNADGKPSISLHSDTDAVYLGDSIIIEVEAVGIVDDLDISPLFKGADLLRETTGTRIAVIDDGVVEVKLRRMEFLPRKQGRVFFGPLSGESVAGTVSSNTVIINVQPPADTHWVPANDDLQISITLTSEGQHQVSSTESADRPFSAYIGQRIIADIELKHKHPIAEEELVLPSFKGFDVLTEFEERRTLLNNSNDDANENSDERWRLTAWRYHLFAQHSGSQSIEGIQWRGTAIRSRTQRASFDRSVDPRQIDILPAVDGFTWWLPASRVSLSETWSKDVRELSAGDEFIRTITLEAQDVLSNHLPVIQPLESRAIKSTLIKQQRSQQLTGDHVQAQAVFEYRMVAQSPIPVFLDTVRVLWFDTQTGETREAIIPARRINVGLPERADLLADLALQDTVSEQWLHRLRAASERFAFWHVTLAGLSVIFLLILALIGRAEFRSRYSGHRNRHVLPDL